MLKFLKRLFAPTEGDELNDQVLDDFERQELEKYQRRKTLSYAEALEKTSESARDDEEINRLNKDYRCPAGAVVRTPFRASCENCDSEETFLTPDSTEDIAFHSCLGIYSEIHNDD